LSGRPLNLIDNRGAGKVCYHVMPAGSKPRSRQPNGLEFGVEELVC
jgi:hypothetical protein